MRVTRAMSTRMRRRGVDLTAFGKRCHGFRLSDCYRRSRPCNQIGATASTRPDRADTRLRQPPHRLAGFDFPTSRTVPQSILENGDGDLIISKAFTWSGPVARIGAVGVARAAYEWALQWSKTFTSLCDRSIIHYQNVGYMLVDIAMRIEACRYLCWKAAHYLDLYDSEGHAMGAMSKVFSCELMFDTVFKCMQVVGVNAVNKEHPLERHLRDSVINPLYDAGTMGISQPSRPQCSGRSRSPSDRPQLRGSQASAGQGLARPPSALPHPFHAHLCELA
jgi:Acyl-CoA dehydrogenase, C-terminal domain